MERADQVLPEGMVDADLSSDRTVHLREQRRRHLHDRNAAEVSRRRESRDIARDASPERDDCAGAIGAGANQRVVDAADRREVLEPFTIRDEDRLLAGHPLKPLAVETPARLRGHHDAACRHAGGVEQLSQPA
jgi:hypothetical protein